MRVVVTGAFGYLGLALLSRVAGRHDVIAIGHPPRAKAPVPPGVKVVHGDLARACDVLAGGDAVVHLAGGGGEARCRQDPVLAVNTIAAGTIRLATAAARRGALARVFASTIAVYGTHRAHGRPYLESDEPAPDDLYGACKRAAELAWAARGGITLRIANIYGAGCGVDLGVHGAVERFARAAATGGELTIYGDGAQRIDYVHVDDVCDAFVQALAAPAWPGETVNIGSGRPVAILELAEACVRAGQALGARPRIVRVPAPEGKAWPDRSLSIDKAARLGWQPRVALDDGIRELVAMMRKGIA